MKRQPIGYILRKFPLLSETFILNEILSLERRGIPIHIFSVKRPNDPCYHRKLHLLQAKITYVPDLLDIKRLWKYQKQAKNTFGKRYWKTLWYCLRGLEPRMLVRFLQSCYIAEKASAMSIGHFHAHFANLPSTVANLTSLLTGIPFSFTAHAADIFKNESCKRDLRKKIHHAKFVVTVSDYNKAFLTSKAGNHDKIKKISNGIDLNMFQPNLRPRSVPFTFLCVARFVEKKGHRVLVEACRILRDQGVDFQCWLVGEGKTRREIEEFVVQNHLQGQILFLGPMTQDDILKQYHLADTFILPCSIGSNGDRDGLPVAIVEALACGLPVITTPMTGNPEVVQHEKNGLLVPFEDPVATANAMKSLICDSTLYQQLKERTRPSIESQFDINKTTICLANLFEECLS